MTEDRAARALVAERGLTVAAVGALIPLMSDVDFDALGEVKALLRRFFSADPWTSIDAAALVRAVGPPGEQGDRIVRRRLDADIGLVAGWVDGAFVLDVEARGGAGASSVPEAVPEGIDLSRTFDLPVVPEPTPNPRTLRFATAERSVPESRGYRRVDVSSGDHAEPGVTAIFAVDADVVDVLVGSDFVAVSVRRPNRWPELLEPVLRAVATHYGGEGDDAAASPTRAPAVDVRGVSAAAAAGAGAGAPSRGRRPSRLDRAWSDLGALDPSDDRDLAAIVAATADADTGRRQVAARLLQDAPPQVAEDHWRTLLTDPSRAVRRAALDAVVDAERPALRPLLELALSDADSWMRWKALHGIVGIGAAGSAAAIEPLHQDPDFRVRLEAANAQREPRASPPGTVD